MDSGKNGKGSGNTPPPPATAAGDSAAEDDGWTVAPLSKRAQRRLRSRQAAKPSPTPAANKDDKTEVVAALVFTQAPDAVAVPPLDEDAAMEVPSFLAASDVVPTTTASKQWLPKQVPSDLFQRIGVAIPRLQVVFTSLGHDRYPCDDDSFNVSTEVERLLKSEKEGAKAEVAASLRLQLASKNRLLTCATAEKDSDLIKVTSTKIKELEAEIAKVAKPSPTTASQVEALKTARQNWNQAHQAKLDKAEKGELASGARMTERWAILDEVQQSVDALRHVISGHDDAYRQAHADRSTSLASFRTGVLAALDSKIADASGGEIAPVDLTSTVDSEEVAKLRSSLVAAKEASSLAASTARAKEKELLDRIASLTSAPAATPPAVAPLAVPAPPAPELCCQFEWVAPQTVNQSDMVMFVPPDKPCLEACSNLHALLHHWSLGGSNTPFTFAELAASSIAGSEVYQLIRSIMGEKIWMTWFKRSDANSILPRQAVTTLWLVLEDLSSRIASKAHEDVATRKLAASAYGILQDKFKKRKVSN